MKFRDISDKVEQGEPFRWTESRFFKGEGIYAKMGKDGKFRFYGKLFTAPDEGQFEINGWDIYQRTDWELVSICKECGKCFAESSFRPNYLFGYCRFECYWKKECAGKSETIKKALSCGYCKGTKTITLRHTIFRQIDSFKEKKGITEKIIPCPFCTEKSKIEDLNFPEDHLKEYCSWCMVERDRTTNRILEALRKAGII